MARRPKRRPFRRPTQQQRTEDTSQQQRRLEAAAQALLETRPPEQLSREVSERQYLLAEADRVAQLDPNPANLSNYRFARSQFEAAQAALALSNSRTESTP